MCLESNWLFTSTKRVIHHDIVNIVIFLAQQAIEQKDANLNVTSILEAQESSIHQDIHSFCITSKKFIGMNCEARNIGFHISIR